MKRNFERFEVGHYYLYIESSLPGFDYHNVSIIKENNIVKCDDTRFRTSAGFLGVENQFPFNWENVFDNWIEVESPDTLMIVGDVIYAPKNKERTIVAVWSGKKNGYEGYYILKRKEECSDKKVKSEVNKYKDGDVVYLRRDLELGDYGSYQHVNESMVRLGIICEKITLRCSDSDSYQYYATSSFGEYYYNDWMIEGLASEIRQEKVYMSKSDNKVRVVDKYDMKDYPFHSKAVDEMSKHYVYSKMTEVKWEDEDDFVPAKITF